MHIRILKTPVGFRKPLAGGYHGRHATSAWFNFFGRLIELRVER